MSSSIMLICVESERQYCQYISGSKRWLRVCLLIDIRDGRRDGSAVELYRETGEEQLAGQLERMADDTQDTTEESGRVT